MPAKLLENETFVEGFGEGTEDAKTIAKYIESIRTWLQPVYSFFDQIVMYRAWNKDFFENLKKEVPSLKGMSYEEAFYEWKNKFTATWPEVLDEPPSKKVKVDQAKMRAIMKLLDTLMLVVDPENRAKLIKWAAINFNELENLFPKAPLELDYEILKNYQPALQQPNKGPGENDDGDGRELAEDEEDEDELEDRGEREEDYGDSQPKYLPHRASRRHNKPSRQYNELNDILEDLQQVRDSMLRGATTNTRADSDRLDRLVDVMGLMIKSRNTPQPNNVNVSAPPVNVAVHNRNPDKKLVMRRMPDGNIEATIYTEDQVVRVPVNTSEPELTGSIQERN
jgi:hypothetical protein